MTETERFMMGKRATGVKPNGSRFTLSSSSHRGMKALMVRVDRVPRLVPFEKAGVRGCVCQLLDTVTPAGGM